MKNSLGKLFTIFFIILQSLCAEDFEYTFDIDNKTPYVKEGIVLTLELNQTNPDVVLLFNFDLKKSDEYTFRRVDIEESDIHHDLRVKYSYLIYPLKSGNINIKFHLLKKVTSDDSVAYSFSGDRDNVKGLVTTDTPISLPSLHLSVKSLPKETLFVGDFKISHNLKKRSAKAYEPLPLSVTIEGDGYPPLLERLLSKDMRFTQFIERPMIETKDTINGTVNKIVYSMALSSSKSFTLDAIEFPAFNPKIEKSYILKIPAQHFEIEEIAKETLVDEVNSPAPIEYDWGWLWSLLSYITVFIAGYISSTAWSMRTKKDKKKANPLDQKIANCRDPKTLLQLLLATDPQRFAIDIEKLESSIYGDKKISFEKIKRELDY